MLIPRQKTPGLTVPKLDGANFDLTSDGAERFTLVVFYRGLHCPICATYLKELERLVPEFESRGVSPIAISSDGQERAQAMAEKVGADKLRFGYGLPLSVARNWGLMISTSRGKTSTGVVEPDLFAEPGVFLVHPDQTLYYGAVQTMPFVRPSFRELVAALDFIIKNDYPARGEYTGAV